MLFSLIIINAAYVSNIDAVIFTADIYLINNADTTF